MTARHPLTPSSDTRAAIPAAAGARVDRIRAAVESLRAEERRLARLGLDRAVRRCREHRRYWEFLGALFALEPEAPRAMRAENAWDIDDGFDLGGVA